MEENKEAYENIAQDILDSAKSLIRRALAEDHSEFELITCYFELRTVRKQKRAMRALSRCYRKAAKDFMKKYATDLANGEESAVTLMAGKTLMIASDFYEDEARLFKDMIKEYRCYLASGHLWKTLLLDFHRPEDDMTDWRELPFGW